MWFGLAKSVISVTINRDVLRWVRVKVKEGVFASRRSHAVEYAVRQLMKQEKQAIVKSGKKTGRLVIVSEDCKTAGVSAEIAALAAEEATDYLDALMKRLAEPDTPIPFSPPLEQYVISNEKTIVKAVKEVV